MRIETKDGNFHIMKKTDDKDGVIKHAENHLGTVVDGRELIVYSANDFDNIKKMSADFVNLQKTPNVFFIQYEQIFKSLRYRYIRVSKDYFDKRGTYNKPKNKYQCAMIVEFLGQRYGNTKTQWLDDFHNGKNGKIDFNFQKKNEDHMMRFDAIDDDESLVFNFYKDIKTLYGNDYFNSHTVDHSMNPARNTNLLLEMKDINNNIYLRGYASPMLEIKEKGKNNYTTRK